MSENKEQLHALIYNRVSSKQQEVDGTGLISQEHRCIVYAENKGYIVKKENVFHDQFSGGGDFMKRPAMKQLLGFIDTHRKERYVVIFDDLKRFARDTKFHIELRSAFNIRNVKVECLNFNFEETPEGNFVETILAAQNQLEREQNQRQVIQKQRSRLETGYWAFSSPLGYTMQKDPKFVGKVAKPNEFAPILKEALEGYANFRFMYQVDVVRFLREKGMFPGPIHNERYVSTVSSILKNPFYAGYIEYPKWNVERIRGVHTALIDESTFQKNLARLDKPGYIKKVRIDDRPDFELRGLLDCIHCKRPFTACFSSGRSIRYPYYLCQTPGCLMYKKAVARKYIDHDFEIEMNRLIPKQELIEEFSSLFEEAWQEAVVKFNNDNKRDPNNMEVLKNDIEKYLELAFSTTSSTVRAHYEEKIEELEKKLKEIEQTGSVKIDLAIPYRTALDKVTEIAKNPYKIWTSSNLTEKKKLYYFFFDAKIQYDIKTRYRTVNPSILYRFFDGFEKSFVDVDTPRNISNQFIELYEFILNWGEYLNSLEITGGASGLRNAA